MRHPIATTHNGMEVYVDLLRSLAAGTIAQHPHLANLAQEVLHQTRVDTAEMVIEQDMQRIIGYDYVVMTSDKDHIFYGKMLHDPVYTRFVKNGKPLATTYLSMRLQRDAAGAYQLQEIWIGKQRPARPGSPNATPESRKYWENHAFAMEGLSVQSRSLTRVCPY